MYRKDGVPLEASARHTAMGWEVTLYGLAWLLDELIRELSDNKEVLYVGGSHFKSDNPDYTEITLIHTPRQSAATLAADAQMQAPKYIAMPAPCPFCRGHKHLNVYTEGTRHFYACDHGGCGARGPARPTDQEALVAWNESQ